MMDIIYQEMLEEAIVNKEYWSLNGKNIMYLPYLIPQGISAIKMLDDIFSKYTKLLSRIMTDSNLIDGISKICSEIVDTMKMFLSGDIIAAFGLFSRMMDEEYGDTFPSKNVEHNILFYRMRSDFDLKEKEQFYHLPSSMRSKCASERYSIAGYPCFYIGYSKNDCFVEISPNGSMIGLSLSADYNIRVLDLTFYNSQNNGTISPTFIKAWPIIAACNLVYSKSVTTDAKFREEYVIPQFLTAYLKNKKKYDGICYYSVRNENLDTLGQNENDYRNLVLFPNLLDGGEHDEELMNKFIWYKPFNVGIRQ